MGKMTEVEALAEAIELPVKEWPGNCYSVALASVRAGAIIGQAVYGHYRGPVVPGTFFWEKYQAVGLVPHGWVSCPFEMVYDPTRWVFEGAEPYVFFDKDDDGYYDEGGNRLRMALMPDRCPAWDQTDRVVDLRALPGWVRGLLADLTGNPPTGVVSLTQLFWLGNLAPQILGRAAKPLYRQMTQMGHGAIIPIDNLRMVLGKEV